MNTYQRRLDLAKITRAPFGAGAFIKGNVLLVGEQASKLKGSIEFAPEQQPFCSDRGCSGWLNRLLLSGGIPEEKLFWVNALNNDGTDVDLRLVVELMRPSVVIALGNVALALVMALTPSVSWVLVPHPQYWKRFKSKERYPLLDLLHEKVNNIRGLEVGVKLLCDKYLRGDPPGGDPSVHNLRPA